jgi:hypothetical protein
MAIQLSAARWAVAVIGVCIVIAGACTAAAKQSDEKVRVRNDLSFAVWLRSCQTSKVIPVGAEATLDPANPCLVFEESTKAYQGCLVFPSAAFGKDEPFLISRGYSDTDQKSCVNRAHYWRHKWPWTLLP